MSAAQLQGRYDLIIEGSHNKKQALAKLISYLFSDQNLYLDRSFRKLVAQDLKGYVHVEEILANQTVRQYFGELEGMDKKQQGRIVKEAVVECCHELYFNSNRIRRLYPFDHSKFTQVKPLGIDNLPHKMTVSDIRSYFGNDAFTNTTQIYPGKNQAVLVYAPSYREKYPTKDDLKSLPFRAIRYETLCYETHREAKFWESSEKRIYQPLEFKLEQMQGEDDTDQDHNERDQKDYIHSMMEEMGKLVDDGDHHHYSVEMMGRMHSSGRGPSYRQREQFEAIAKKPNPEYNRTLIPFLKSRGGGVA